MRWLTRAWTWLVAKITRFAGAYRKRLNCGPTPSTAAPSYAWSDTTYPHSSTGLVIAYPDFTTSYQSAGAAATTRAFAATHADKIISGGEPTGGYPAGLIHQPYILTVLVYSDGTSSGSLIGNAESDYASYCTAHALDPEDGYLHYPSGGVTYADPVDSISATGLMILTYDTQTYASVYAAGQVLTLPTAIGGYSGTVTIGSVSVVGGKTNLQLTTTAAAGTGGTVTRTGDGTKTRSNRYRMKVSGFGSPRWSINPKSTVRRAYETDRAARLLAGSTLSYVPEGTYVDEVAEGNVNHPAGATTVEYSPANATQFYTDLGAMFAAIRAGVTEKSKWTQEIGSASYFGPNTSLMLDGGAASGQAEQLLNIRISGNWPGTFTTWTAQRLAAGDAMELSSPYTPIDTISGGGGVYASDPVPASCHDAANVRMMASCFVVALLCVDPARPGQLAVNLWNGGWGSPTYDTAGLDLKWIDLLKAPLGPPTGAFTVIVPSGTDTAGQGVKVTQRDFAAGSVFYRSCTVTSGVYDDTATYTLTLPTSTGAGGAWRRVKSDGSLDTAVTTIALRQAEGVVMFPA